MAMQALSLLSIVLVALSAAGAPGNLDDNSLADKALAAIGAPVSGSTQKCAGCHQLTVSTVGGWLSATRDGDNCMKPWRASPNRTSAETTLKCLSTGTGLNFDWNAKKLGLLSGRAETAEFTRLFADYFGASTVELDRFRRKVNMPRSGAGNFTDVEWGLIWEWAERGAPFINEKLNNPGSVSDCVTKKEPALDTLLAQRERKSWKSINKQKNLLMYACSNPNDPATCFKKKSGGKDVFPEVNADPATKNWNLRPGQWSMRKLTEIQMQTQYWSRISPDGRFLAVGVTPGIQINGSQYQGLIMDLNPILSSRPHREIGVDARFDPSFFPDNSSFVFQDPNMMCPMSLLLDERRKTVERGDCTSASMNQYHSSGIGLNGDDYGVVSGEFEWDDGGRGDVIFDFGKYSSFTYESFLFDGKTFTEKSSDSHEMAYQGNFMLSPSTEILNSMRSYVDSFDSKRRNNYEMSLITRNSNGTVSTKAAARICRRGGKPTFSFDERFFTYYKYISSDDFAEYGFASPGDADFKKLVDASVSNIFLYDLKTMRHYRLTNMRPGEMALFPAFRSDNWIYFMVLSANGMRTFVATDSALNVR
jgi:hypothetical protein